MKLSAAKLVLAAVAFAAIACASSAQTAGTVSTGNAATTLVSNPAGSQPSAKGPAQFFTGAVRVDTLNAAKAPSRATSAYVTFEPGARSAWHTHPLGQTLIVTAGSGRVQQWGGAVENMRSGDTVWIPPGVKHWHGATPSTGMTHIAITETLDGKNVDWMEQVTDEQYGK
jgi:quercetin dioxygenase-like cupin family protein